MSAEHTPLVFSGMQPTGNLHLGNYLGAMRNWLKLQSSYRCVYCVVDLHAMTMDFDPQQLAKASREVAAAYIASGVDPQRSVIFVQSGNSDHAELAWIFNCVARVGWLNRMTQFKEKAGKDKENAVLGLYSYPVLMAADIILYKATHVPVGHDQKQHVELTRDIAGAFNRYYKTEFFPLPEPVIMGEATRVMSLRDGKKKMSKSDESDYSRINLTDDADTIALKFRKAKSDMVEGISYDTEARPEVSNLLNLYASFRNITREQALAECEGKNNSAFKQMLTEVAVAHLSPITSKMRELLKETDYLDKVLGRGVQRAEAVASQTLKEVKELAGFLNLKH